MIGDVVAPFPLPSALGRDGGDHDDAEHDGSCDRTNLSACRCRRVTAVRLPPVKDIRAYTATR
jgi:hypothetical protein